MESEWEQWKGKTILRILISTAVKSKKKSDLDASECVTDKEYFIRLDKDEIENLFGVAFHRLVTAVREGNNKTIPKLDELRSGEARGKRDEEDHTDLEGDSEGGGRGSVGKTGRR